MDNQASITRRLFLDRLGIGGCSLAGLPLLSSGALAAPAAKAGSGGAGVAPNLSAIDGGMPPEADYALDQPPPGFAQYGENHAFWFFDKDNKVHGYTHLEAFQDWFPLKNDRTWLALPDGRVLYNWTEGFQSSPRKPAGANSFYECVEPFRRWSVNYLGTMQISSADELRRGRPTAGSRALVRYHLDVVTAAPPFPQGKLGMAPSAEVLNAIGGTRYEQLFRVTGTVHIDNETIELAGAGVRTHRQGLRNMTGWHGHSWQTALFPSGRGFHLYVNPGSDGPEGRAKPMYAEAVVLHEGTLHPAEVLQCSWLDSYSAHGDRSQIRLRSKLGEAVIDAEILASVWRTFHIKSAPGRHLNGYGVWGDPGSFPNNQGAARYTWDGETTIGQVERSTAIEFLPKA